MKLINNTNYLTKDLQKLLRDIVKKIGLEHKYLRVFILYKRKRNQWRYGHAILNGYRIWLELDRESYNKTRPEILAKNFVHELRHIQGLRHDEMIYTEHQKWAKDYQLRLKQNKPKIKRDLKKERFEKAKNKVKELESKLKRYNNLLKKQEKKVRYYEKS